jgi:hypothetical protein
LKNLDALNPAIASPRSFSSTAAALPFLLGILCLPLAFSAAPTLPFARNLLALLCALQSITSLFLMIVPRLFCWDWRAKFFGASSFYIGSVSVVGIVPMSSVVCFSILPIWIKSLVFIAYVAPLVWWCKRFFDHYAEIFANEISRKMLYHEDSDAIYYMQGNDDLLIKKRKALTHFPSNLFFILAFAIAIAILPFALTLVNVTGIPTIHLLLTILGLPIALMCSGFAARGFLIFYYYPYRLKQECGKDVYVLMG